MLKKLGHSVVEVENGQRAIETFTEANVKREASVFDMILMDCEMPEVDGYMATTAIRQIEKQHKMLEIPIVALTAHAIAEYLDKCLSVGMNNHVSKPLVLHALNEAIELSCTP